MSDLRPLCVASNHVVSHFNYHRTASHIGLKSGLDRPMKPRVVRVLQIDHSHLEPCSTECMPWLQVVMDGVSLYQKQYRVIVFRIAPILPVYRLEFRQYVALRPAPSCFASHRVTPHHVTSHHITSHDVTSRHVTGKDPAHVTVAHHGKPCLRFGWVL